MQIRPGVTLTDPFFPSVSPFEWQGQFTTAVQEAFRKHGDRIEELTTFGTRADLTALDAKGTATFFFVVDEGKLFFDGLDENGVAEWVWLGAEPVAMMQMAAAAGLDGETGFYGTNTDSAISVDANAREVSIQPTGASYDVWCESTKYVKTGVESVVVSADAGIHAVVFNPSGVLTDLGTGFGIEDIIVNNSYVCEVYVNGGVIKWVADERHGLMPWQVHVQQHLSTGTVHRSGLGLINFDIDGNGSLDSHAEFDGASGLILDEDLTVTITAATSIPLLYRSGSSWDISTTFDPPIIQQTGSCCYNHYGASWELTAVPDNHFFLVHIFASPIKWVGSTPTSGYVAILGQEEYLNVIQARDGASQEISDIVTSGLPMAEFVPVGTVIYKANSGYANTYKCAVVSDANGDEYVSWLNTIIEAGLPPSAHPNLTHRDHADQHPAASITPVASGWTGVLSTSDTTVQAALDTLNGHTHDDRYYTEDEADSLLSGKSDTGHAHTESDISDLGDYLPLAGGTVTGDLIMDWGTALQVDVGAGAGPTDAVSGDLLGIVFGQSGVSCQLVGVDLHPTYNGTNLVLSTEMPAGYPYLPLAGGTLTGDLEIEDGSLATQHNFASVSGDVDLCQQGGQVTIGGSGGTQMLTVVGGAIGVDNGWAFRGKNNGGTYVDFLKVESGGYRCIMGVTGSRTKIVSNDSVLFPVPKAVVSDANHDVGTWTVWVDESAHTLNFKVKYSTGTVKSGSIALA